MAPSKLIATERHSTRDLRDAKRDWSQRLLTPVPVAAILETAMARRTGAHAIAPRAARGRRNPNVVGVGVAEKSVHGRPTGVLAVKFFVKTKFPKRAVSPAWRLPKEIDGLPVDVEESGTLRAFRRKARRAAATDGGMPDPRLKMRPALPGCSLGFRIAGDVFVMAGTFGALVKTSRTVYILSNNHVLADENRLAVGAPIYQPALLDHGDLNTDQIARLTRFVRMRANRYNRVDAAIAQPLSKTLVGRQILHMGAPRGTATAEIDMMVHKFGRTTSYTAGRVASIDTDVIIEYETGDFTFEGQILVTGTGEPFSEEGDSGSIILERGTNAAIGLLFGGSSTHTIANHIGNVLRSLRVRLA